MMSWVMSILVEAKRIGEFCAEESNTAMIPFAQGMGFAIPSETIKRIMDQISRNGRVIRPWLGISGMDVTKSVSRRYNLGVETGVLLAEVLREAPATEAGLRVGDIVMKIADSKVESMKDLVGALSHLSIGDEVSVQFVRNGTSYETKLKLRQTPERITAQRR